MKIKSGSSPSNSLCRFNGEDVHVFFQRVHFIENLYNAVTLEVLKLALLQIYI